MNVMNLFEENAQWRKPLSVPTAPYTETPNIAAQVHNAFGDAPKFDANAPFVPVQPEPTYEERLKNRMDESMRLYGNPLYNLIDKGTPPLDEKRQQRLKLAAGINAFGQGLSTLYGGYIGSKGGPIMAQDNTFTPAALKEYNDRINADNEAKYRNAMAKASIAGNVFQQSARQLELEDMQKQRAQDLKENRLWNEAEHEKQRQFQIELAKAKPGADIEGQIAVINARAEATLKLIRERNAEARALLELKSKTNMTEADYKSKLRKINEKYKAEKDIITVESEDATGKKTKTQSTRLVDQNAITPPTRTSSDPDDEFLVK